MAENYKHLYEQMKKMVTQYQDEIVPGLQQVIADLEKQRPKGRWIYKWDAERDPKRLFVRIVCSECNLHTGQKSNYCPNCGADMTDNKGEIDK